jgi:serine/threonine protein kinase
MKGQAPKTRMATSTKTDRVCPVCKAEFTGLEEFCPSDGAPLSAADERDSLIGKRIDERYELLRRLGRGAMGIVYLARHCHLDRLFAVKLLRRELVGDALTLRRFQREARAAGAVVHPNIVHTYDYGQSGDGRAYLVMEYVEGMMLRAVAAKAVGRQLPPSQTVDLVLQVVQALAAAHAHGIIHRDIKPENILVTHKDYYGEVVKVADFGMARILSEQRLTTDGAIVGTPEFIAPEMLAGSDVGPPADMYAVGIMLQELLVGSAPFTGSLQAILGSHVTKRAPRILERRPDLKIPADLDALGTALLQKDPAQRPSAQETINQLMQIRPRLPPRSARSLALSATMAARDPRPPSTLHSAETLLLSTRRSALLQTLEMQSLLREMDEIDLDLERTSQQIHRLVTALVRRRWPRGAPSEIARQLLHLKKCETTEEELGVRQALLREESEREERDSDARRAHIHRDILALRDRLTEEVPPGDPQRIALYQQLAALELAYAAIVPERRVESELSQLHLRLHELRSEIQRNRRDLATAVLSELMGALAASPDSTLAAACQGLDQCLREFDRLCMAMTVLMKRMPDRAPLAEPSASH